MTMQALAQAIADNAARSDIEIFAFGYRDDAGNLVFDLTKPEGWTQSTPEGNAHAIEQAQRAARYIELRGDVFPWRMVHVGNVPHLVRFEEKQ